MLPRKIAGRYAEALFSLAQDKGKIQEWGEELLALAGAINDSPDLHQVLIHPEIPLVKKQGVVTQAFQGKIVPEVLAVLFMLIKKGHDPDLRTVYAIFIERWNSTRRVLPVTVQSATPLSAEQQAALIVALGKRTGATIQLQHTVDPELIAGLIVTMGDRVIDASARNTLEQLRVAMTGI